MFNQNANLPFSAEQPQGQWREGLPQNIPGIPPLDIPPQMRDMAAMATGLYMHVLQEKATLNPLRTFLYNQNAYNDFQNEEFKNGVDLVFRTAEMILASERVQPVQAVEKAANVVAKMLAAVNIGSYPALANYVVDPKAQHEAEKLVNEFNGLLQDIQQFYSQAQAPAAHNPWGPQQGGGSGWGSQQSSGWGGQSSSPWGAPPTRRSYNDVPPRQANNNLSRMAMASSYTGGAQSMMRGGGYNEPVADAPSTQGQGGWGRRPRAPEPEPDPSEISGGPGSKPTWKWEGASTQSDQMFKQVKINDDFTTEDVPVRGARPQTKVPKGSADEIVQEDGSILRPAFKSGWKVTDESLTIRVAIDPTKEILYHKRLPSGVVTEVTMGINDENEYLASEMNPTFAQKVKDERAQASKPVKEDWSSVNKPPEGLGNIDEINDERNRRLSLLEVEEEDKQLFKDDRVLIASTMTAANAQEARLAATLSMIDAYGEAPDDQAFEYIYYECAPTLSKDKKVFEKLKHLCECRNYQELVERFLAVRTSMDDQTWHRLHDRMTDHVNEILRVGMRLVGESEVTIDSLVDDAADLIEVLSGDMKLDVTPFQGTASTVAQANCHPLQDKLRDQYVQRLEYPAESPDIVDDILVFGSLNCVTDVPWYSTELHLQFDGDLAAVTESKLPELYSAIEKVFRQVDKLKKHSFRSVYIITADNVRLNLHRSVYGGDFFLITK